MDQESLRRLKISEIHGSAVRTWTNLPKWQNFIRIYRNFLAWFEKLANCDLYEAVNRLKRVESRQ